MIRRILGCFIICVYLLSLSGCSTSNNSDFLQENIEIVEGEDSSMKREFATVTETGEGRLTLKNTKDELYIVDGYQGQQFSQGDFVVIGYNEKQCAEDGTIHINVQYIFPASTAVAVPAN